MMTACVLWMMTFCIAVCFVLPSVLAETATAGSSRQESRDRAFDVGNRAKPTTAVTSRKTSNKPKLSKQANRETVATTPKTDLASSPAIQQSYSYDSQSSWTKRIPKRYTGTRDSDILDVPLPLHNKEPKAAVNTYGPPSTENVNRTTNPAATTTTTGSRSSAHVKDSIQAYISKRLDRIEELSDV
jgi:hypothetical protein